MVQESVPPATTDGYAILAAPLALHSNSAKPPKHLRDRPQVAHTSCVPQDTAYSQKQMKHPCKHDTMEERQPLQDIQACGARGRVASIRYALPMKRRRTKLGSQEMLMDAWMRGLHALGDGIRRQLAGLPHQAQLRGRLSPPEAPPTVGSVPLTCLQKPCLRHIREWHVSMHTYRGQPCIHSWVLQLLIQCACCPDHLSYRCLPHTCMLVLPSAGICHLSPLLTQAVSVHSGVPGGFLTAWGG